MWANWEIAVLADWLRGHNDGLPKEERVGFYGLDLYSLWESLAAVIGYLTEHQPDAVAAAHQAFRCFQPYAEDPQQYALGTLFVPDGCRGRSSRSSTPSPNAPPAGPTRTGRASTP